MYAFLADVHIGVKLPTIDFLKSLDKFLGLIKAHKEECHAIFVAGDLFDHKLSTAEAKIASLFMVNLVCNFCGRNKRLHVPVYFIHGTYSHDQDQYEIFMPILEKLNNVDVFYINSVCEMTLFNGKHVLFIPQEYGEISYKNAFSKHYDLIVGHGPIASNTKSPCKSAKYEILHSAELLGEISDLCVFGHYHEYTDFGNHVYYVGTWLRWRYGEDSKKVFFLCNDAYEVETTENPFAMEFQTIEIHNPEELRTVLNEKIDTPHRFIIESSANDMELYKGIINTNSDNPNLKFQLTEIVDEDDLQLSVDEVLDAQTEAVQPVPALITYIKDKYGIDPTDKISEYEATINKEE